MNARTVWVAKDDGSDIVRADAIAGIGRDYNGNITVRLVGGDSAAVTLVAPEADRPATPDDFHRRLIKMAAELSDKAEASIVRPVCDEKDGWHWISEPL